jgi:putative PIN family toxin of toxin-antitoxin system
MRVVLDTNTLLVSIGRQSKYRPIFDAFLEGRIKLLVSNDTFSEYVEKLEEKTNPIIAQNIAHLLLRSPDVEKIEIYFKWAIIYQDGDDNKFVDCALNGDADYIVTDDKHFEMLQHIGFPMVKVLKTAAFLELTKTGW